jgi:putative oxidoreductase
MNSAANPYAPLLARIFLAALFLISGIGKVLNFAGTAGYLGKLGLPMPEVMAMAAIAVEIGGALLLIIGWKTRWVAWGMAIFTLITMLAGHAFWQFEGQQFNAQLTQFLKNLAIIGGFILLAVAGPGRLSVDKG